MPRCENLLGFTVVKNEAKKKKSPEKDRISALVDYQ